MKFDKEKIKKEIEKLGIGILFIVMCIIISLIMISWIIYNIFISSKG